MGNKSYGPWKGAMGINHMSDTGNQTSSKWLFRFLCLIKNNQLTENKNNKNKQINKQIHKWINK